MQVPAYGPLVFHSSDPVGQAPKDSAICDAIGLWKTRDRALNAIFRFIREHWKRAAREDPSLPQECPDNRDEAFAVYFADDNKRWYQVLETTADNGESCASLN